MLACCTSSRPQSASPVRKPVVGVHAPGAIPPVAGNRLVRVLPDQAPPFAAIAPIEKHAGFFRRTYAVGDKQVEITVARMGGDAGAYQSWVAGSLHYPQAALALPATEANGFFTCSSESSDAACDLHIQLRKGFHVEFMGNGRVPRADLTSLLAHIPLAEITAASLAGT